MVQPTPVQMIHTHYSTYDRAEIPPDGKAADDLNAHIARHLAAGWTMAFYSTGATSAGTIHHFIWRAPA